MTSQHKKTPKRSQLQPHMKIWLELEGEYAFGFGISRILQAVGDTGSMKAAAESLDKSYRYVWSRIKQAEQTLGRSLVQTQVGGSGLKRSSLTELAVHLVENYDQLRQQMLKVVQNEFAVRFYDRL